MFFETIVIDKRLKIDDFQPKTPGSAGIDLFAAVERAIDLPKGERCLIPTGICVHIARPDWAGFIVSRSGLAHRKGLVVGNAIGVIDSDYTGEIMVSVLNSGQNTIKIDPLERFAQLIFMQVGSAIKLKEVARFADTERGAGGFGSTGVTK
jgi:dUTP pyrophosphatase